MSLPLSGANITTGPFGVPCGIGRGPARNSRAVYQTTLSPYGPSPRDLVGGWLGVLPRDYFRTRQCLAAGFVSGAIGG